MTVNSLCFRSKISTFYFQNVRDRLAAVLYAAALAAAWIARCTRWISAFGALDDSGLEELRVQIDPQSWADGSVVGAGNEATMRDRADMADFGGEALSVAGRPEPPAARGFATCCFATVTGPGTLRDCVLRRRTFAGFICSKVFPCFRNTEKEDLIVCRVAGVRTITWVFICADICRCYFCLFIGRKRIAQKRAVQPIAKAAFFPRYVCMI